MALIRSVRQDGRNGCLFLGAWESQLSCLLKNPLVQAEMGHCKVVRRGDQRSANKTNIVVLVCAGLTFETKVKVKSRTIS